MTMKNTTERAVVYVHGKGGSADEARHYEALFPNCTVLGFAYRAQTPWEAKEEFSEYFHRLFDEHRRITLIANSIGAYFSMQADLSETVERAFFISPVVDMENLIRGIMTRAGVTESELKSKIEIQTDFGERLSWAYYRFAKENPPAWKVPTHLLYGEKDALTALETVQFFAEKTGATLDVMPGGEHWFHTTEQMAFLDRWIGKYSPAEGGLSSWS